MPRGGSVWLGTLLAFFKGMGVGENVVRSAVSRLTAEDWLIRTKVGRNSFYHLAARGQDTFAQAARKIYHQPRQSWNGAFEALLVEAPVRDSVATALEQAGFGMPMPGLFIAPGGSRMAETAQAEGVRLTLAGGPEELRELAARAWKLPRLAVFYQRFADVFAPLRLALAQGQTLSPLEAILARVLLIHEYRRVALRDPMLPSEILPISWPGSSAQVLCAELYARLLPLSEVWLNDYALAEGARNLPENQDIYRRFQGLS